MRNTLTFGCEYVVPPPPPRSYAMRRAALVLVAACAALLAACSSGTSGQPAPAADSSCIGSGCTATIDTRPPTNTYVITVPATTVPASPAAPAMTTSQANAVRKAESYLRYAAFSRTGLIKQLQYEGFSAADATYAVDHITVDWTEQADKKAASYMSYSAFSRSGLIKQLQYEGFTADQAAHGAKSVGL